MKLTKKQLAGYSYIKWNKASLMLTKLNDMIRGECAFCIDTHDKTRHTFQSQHCENCKIPPKLCSVVGDNDGKSLFKQILGMTFKLESAMRKMLSELKNVD